MLIRLNECSSLESVWWDSMKLETLSDKVITSHIGSFPLEYSLGNIERIIHDLAKIGIDIPPYPQLRDFIEVYVQPLEKAKLVYREGKHYRANTDTLLESKPPQVSIVDIEYARNILAKYRFKSWRAPITGVFTIASKIYIDDPSRSIWATVVNCKEILLSFLKEYVVNIVKYAYSLGYRFIVLDEPILTNIVGARRILFNYTVDELIELYDSIFKSIPRDTLTGIHVCGRIPPKLHEILCQIPSLKVLSHEFKGTPENINTIRRDLLEKYDKILSPGIVSSKNPVIESYNETMKLLTLLVERFGNRVNIVTPDCGFAALRATTRSLEDAYRLSLEKLKVIVNVARSFKTKSS